jgi:hypothetical protein
MVGSWEPDVKIFSFGDQDENFPLSQKKEDKEAAVSDGNLCRYIRCPLSPHMAWAEVELR